MHTAPAAQMDRLTATSNTDEILREIGARLRAFRLQQNRTVAQLAAQAGVGRRTIVRGESGAGMTLETLVKLLRALGRVEALEGFLPPALVSPLQLAERQGRVRERAWAPRPSRKGAVESDATARATPAPRRRGK